MNEVRKLEDMIKSGKYNLNEIINQLCEVSGVIASKQSEIEDLERRNSKLHTHIDKITFENEMYRAMIKGIIEEI